MTDYERLRQLADMATPGPWTTTPGGGAAILIIEIEDDFRDDYHGIYATGHVAPGKSDAEFVAACDPDTVRNLLEDLRLTREDLVAEKRKNMALRKGQGRYTT